MSINRNKQVVGGIKAATGAFLSAVLAGASGGCSPGIIPQDQLTSASQNQNNAAALASNIKLSIRNQSGTEVFSDKNTFSMFKIVQGTTYRATVTGTNVPAGATLALSIKNLAQVGATSTIIPLTSNSGQSWSASLPANLGAADYETLLVVKGATGSKLTEKAFTASVACASSPLANTPGQGGLVSATAQGPARFTFNAGSLVNAVIGANSGAPQNAGAYTCAFDYTGIAAMDGGFGPCSVSNVVANYVGTRNISVQVRESTCNTTLSYSTAVTLAGATPGAANGAPFGYNGTPSTAPGSTFIWGQVKSGSGPATIDPRVGSAGSTPGVNYLAVRTPQAGYLDVTNQTNGPSLTGFNIRADYAYAQPGVVSPANFGMEVAVNLGSSAINSLNLTPGQPSYPATEVTPNARISRVAYKTDQIGDSAPALALSGTNCTTNRIYVQPLTVALAGGSCGSGCTMVGSSAGQAYNLTYVAWGDYSCQVSDGTNTVLVQGSFSGQSNIQGDTTNCSCGGQGQGGGSGGGPMSF